MKNYFYHKEIKMLISLFTKVFSSFIRDSLTSQRLENEIKRLLLAIYCYENCKIFRACCMHKKLIHSLQKRIFLYIVTV